MPVSNSSQWFCVRTCKASPCPTSIIRTAAVPCSGAGVRYRQDAANTSAAQGRKPRPRGNSHTASATNTASQNNGGKCASAPVGTQLPAHTTAFMVYSPTAAAIFR